MRNWKTLDGAFAALAILLAPSAVADDVVVQLGAGDGFVVQDNTGAVERYRIDEATGNISKDGVLFLHTTGIDDTFVGENAGASTEAAASNNSAFGAGALQSNIMGADNSAFGWGA